MRQEMDESRNINAPTVALWIVLFVLIGAGHGCAPRPTYRPPPPPPIIRPPVQPPAPPPPPVQESLRKPLPEDPKIKEQNLPSKGAGVARVPKDSPSAPPTPSIPAQPAPPPLPDDSSLIAKITPGTAPQRAVSLRLTEEGRKLIDAGAPGKGLPRLEQSIAIDSTNPYGYFYLAKAHNKLGRYKESLSFLDVAESRLAGEPYWLAEVHALRGENFRALGMVERAEESFNRALSINSGNRTAAEAISRSPNHPAPLPR
jgi:hypothetical protein